MKKLLIVAGLLMALGVGKANAADPDLIRSSATVIAAVSVSSSVTAQIDAGLNLLTGRFLVMIDVEGADPVRCGFSDAVTKTANGFLIDPDDPPFILKLSSNIPIYCRATGATSIDISLTQGKSR